MNKKAWMAFIVRAVLLCCCWIGLHGAVFSADGFMASDQLLYFTYQSNLWVLVMTAVYLVVSIIRLVKGRVSIPRALQIARYAVAVAITITFLVFWGLLSPSFRGPGLFSLNNIIMHTVVPILFVADFLLFDRGKPMGRLSALWAASLPLYYLLFAFAHAAIYPAYRFHDGSRYAYFFLDADTLGWFSFEAGMGVAWWILILTCATLLLGYGYRFIQRKTIKTG